jgi:large subunit ribosomal protein L18
MNVKLAKQRALRVRSSVKSVSDRPRLTVFRSNVHIWAQIIQDQKGATLVAVNDKSLKGTKTEKATLVGTKLAELATKAGIKAVVFDRGPYRYHGRIKALAEAARKAGLII